MTGSRYSNPNVKQDLFKSRKNRFVKVFVITSYVYEKKLDLYMLFFFGSLSLEENKTKNKIITTFWNDLTTSIYWNDS